MKSTLRPWLCLTGVSLIRSHCESHPNSSLCVTPTSHLPSPLFPFDTLRYSTARMDSVCSVTATLFRPWAQNDWLNWRRGRWGDTVKGDSMLLLCGCSSPRRHSCNTLYRTRKHRYKHTHTHILPGSLIFCFRDSGVINSSDIPMTSSLGGSLAN